jgi:hypothetical protein
MNIFLAFTPYHSLLAYSVALEHRENDNVLFVISEFSGAKEITKLMKNSSFNVFTDVICLPGANKNENVFKKIFARRNNTIFLKKFIFKNDIKKVFVGNNARIEAQATLYNAKKINPGCQGIYLEDGTGAYRSEIPARSNLFTKLFCKIFFGLWWHDENIMGKSSYIDTCYAIFPDFVRQELKRKKVVAIKKENFLKIAEDKAIPEYFKSLDFDANVFKEIDVLLISLHSDMLNEYPRLKESMNIILSNIEKQKLSLVVKYHPREFIDDFLKQKEKKNVLILPKAIPLELLYVVSQIPPKVIIGGHSTALLTARWIFPNAKVISTALLFDYYDQNIFEVFNKNNIVLISNIKEIEETLWSITKNL